VKKAEETLVGLLYLGAFISWFLVLRTLFNKQSFDWNNLDDIGLVVYFISTTGLVLYEHRKGKQKDQL